MNVDKFKGVLLGTGIGDALGAPYEMMKRDDILDSNDGEEVREMVGGGWLKVRPGETTDDTAMALCIARSLVKMEAFDPLDIAREFIEWIDSEPKGTGRTTTLALKYLKENPGDLAGVAALTSEEKHSGNGAIMRSAPLALFFFKRGEDELIEASIQTARITHCESRAIEVSVLQNLAVDVMLADLNRFVILPYLSDCAEELEVQKALEKLEEREYHTLDPRGFSVTTLECALWCFLNADSFEDAVVKAVNLGGDADTIAAVTGALAGAYWGANAIPERWLDVLEGRDEMEYLGEELFRLSQRPS